MMVTVSLVVSRSRRRSPATKKGDARSDWDECVS